MDWMPPGMAEPRARSRRSAAQSGAKALAAGSSGVYGPLARWLCRVGLGRDRSWSARSYFLNGQLRAPESSSRPSHPLAWEARERAWHATAAFGRLGGPKIPTSQSLGGGLEQGDLPVIRADFNEVKCTS